MVEPLRIHLLGGFLLERGGITLPPIASLRGRSLLAYLATNKGRPIQRDLLAGMFWPDSPEGRSRRRLSHTLWQIQDVVNTPARSYIRSNSQTIELDPTSPLWLDVEEFDENFIATSSPNEPDRGTKLRRCVDLYRGDFMAGHFDDWVMVEQDIYRQRFLAALQRLIGVTKATGSYDEALDYAKRLTHHDALNEEAHREVMRLNVLLGRTSQAVEQYERVRSVLEEEMGAEPSPATHDIFQKILRQRRSGIHPPLTSKPAMLLGGSSEAPFVGRDDERRLVVDAMERVLGGSGGVVLMEGEPGVGKTRLAFELAEDARWRGFEVSWGACTDGAVRPFAPLVEVLGSLNPLRVEQLAEVIEPVWLGEAGRIAQITDHENSEPETTLRPSEGSDRMIEALVQTLEALGRISPHLIFIDDVHWADRDTLTVLRQASTRLAGSRVLLVLIYRSEEARGDPYVWDTLRDLDKGSGLGRAVLSPLSVFELENMVRRILGTTRLEPSVSASLHRQTGGNVLFTIETLLAMRDEGLFETETDPVSVLATHIEDRQIPVAPRVRSIIESRLALLKDEVTSIFELVALVGNRITIELLETVTKLDRSEVLHAVDELLYRGLVRDEGDGRYRVAHDQIRQVVVEVIDPDRRIVLHKRVASALIALDPDHVEAIGHHFRAGGEEAQAIHYLHAAGRRAVELNAFATARHHLRAATATADGIDLDEAQLFEMFGSLFDVLDVLGRRDEQHDVLGRLHQLAHSLPNRRSEVARRRAWLLAQEASFAQAEESAELSVRLDEKDQPTESLSRSLVILGTIRRWSGRPLEAIEPLHRAATISKSDEERAEALTELASTLVEVQQVAEALEHLSDASAIFIETEDLRGQAEVAGIEARALRTSGDRDGAVERYASAIALCRRIGYRHGEGMNLTNLSNLHQLVGDVAQSLAGYDRAASIFSDMGNTRGEAMVLVNSASARHNVLGEDDRARKDALRAMTHFDAIGDKARHAQCLEIVAGTEARAGHREDARRLLRESLHELEGVGNTSLEVQHLRSKALLWAEDGDLERAIGVLDDAEALSEKAGLGDLSIDLMSIRGWVEFRRGNPESGYDLAATAALNVSPGVGRPYLIHHRLSVIAEAENLTEVARAAAIEADALLRTALRGLDPDTVEAAIARVPEHLAIAERARRFAPKKVRVQLPSSDAPTGRALETDELVPVVWTVTDPEDDQVSDAQEVRKLRVLRLLAEAEEQGATPSVRQLADALCVSETTIRRDINALRDEGHSAHTRGHRQTGS